MIEQVVATESWGGELNPFARFRYARSTVNATSGIALQVHGPLIPVAA
jgi:hypothetical protein